MTKQQDDRLRQAADATASQIVEAYGHDVEALLKAIASLALTGMRCAAEAYLREHGR